MDIRFLECFNLYSRSDRWVGNHSSYILNENKTIPWVIRSEIFIYSKSAPFVLNFSSLNCLHFGPMDLKSNKHIVKAFWI